VENKKKQIHAGTGNFNHIVEGADTTSSRQLAISMKDSPSAPAIF
jgi:hypothetical protein